MWEYIYFTHRRIMNGKLNKTWTIASEASILRHYSCGRNCKIMESLLATVSRASEFGFCSLMQLTAELIQKEFGFPYYCSDDFHGSHWTRQRPMKFVGY